jgi:glycogen debranching enzyme
MVQPQTKTHRLSDPIATCGDRVYVISTQNGLFPDSWGGHVPQEMAGVWDHPIKLLDGYWFGVSAGDAPTRWLSEAMLCRAGLGWTEFVYHAGPLHITRRDFVPDGVEGLIVTLDIASDEALDDVKVHALFRSDLRPTWLGEQAGMVDGKDSATFDAGGRCIFSDANNAWCCAVAADAAPMHTCAADDLWAVNRTSGNGTSAEMTFSPLPRGEGLGVRVYIAGSAQSQADALATLEKLQAHGEAMFAEKSALADAINNTSEVTTPDAQLNEALGWSKWLNQMFMRETPLGRCVGAGMPEYPWWFGIDTEYAVLPMLQSGQFELVRDSLRLLKQQSELRNPTEPGRVIHEMSTAGAVFNDGNLVETPAFTRAVHDYYLWTGDLDFLREMYPFCKRGLLDYTLGACDADGDLCGSGRSIIETLEMHAGFEVIDVAAYTYDALVRLQDMAKAIGDENLTGRSEAKVEDLSGLLAQRIRDEWWLEEEGLFADVRAGIDHVEQVLAYLEQQAISQEWLLDPQKQVQAARNLFTPYLQKHVEQPRDIDLPWLLRHWVVLCPLEVGIATPAQAERALQRLMSAEFCNEWGMFLHPQRHDVMSINTGLLALCAARYGRMDDALSIVNKLVNAFGHRTPGAVCEALPDKWCFIQLWSNLGLVSPVVEGFLGLQPRAHERMLRIQPHLPAAWDHLEARRLRIGNAYFDIRVARKAGGYDVDVQGPADWRVEIVA